MLLEKIERSSDMKNFREEEYPLLAQEIRRFLIEKISNTGGHLASNLGVVELTPRLEARCPPVWLIFSIRNRRTSGIKSGCGRVDYCNASGLQSS